LGFIIVCVNLWMAEVFSHGLGKISAHPTRNRAYAGNGPHEKPDYTPTPVFDKRLSFVAMTPCVGKFSSQTWID
jgi:hypothetical protein